jgi:hypothetical protein
MHVSVDAAAQFLAQGEVRYSVNMYTIRRPNAIDAATCFDKKLNRPS